MLHNAVIKFASKQNRIWFCHSLHVHGIETTKLDDHSAMVKKIEPSILKRYLELYKGQQK